MNTFHRFELPHRPLNFSSFCPDYSWCTHEGERVCKLWRRKTWTRARFAGLLNKATGRSVSNELCPGLLFLCIESQNGPCWTVLCDRRFHRISVLSAALLFFDLPNKRNRDSRVLYEGLCLALQLSLLKLSRAEKPCEMLMLWCAYFCGQMKSKFVCFESYF